ncbi:ornithine carbamoyltransferase [Ktedonobacter robiniae]|uniref:Ornithine carbamoyltransferase n=1 Tax=Ktedonobacter robiniae TaxID=2778365 RepID=A0ABQ3UWV4_9CHLR|nr:ornithine carbamoyltransferase [Ktedonobacter robiniae]GHO57165.1 ornithine carbamoyltransferase [Ktedonobacter robiniae]
MPFNLFNKSLLTLKDFSAEEIHYLLDQSAELKAARAEGRETQRLRGKNIVLIFERDSTRTRTSFEVAAFEQGAQVTYIGPSGSHIGYKETIQDTARVLGRMYSGIEYRGASQQNIEALARYAGVPVWNGMTDEEHPLQVLADLLTMREHTSKPLSEVAFAFLGHVGFNMGRSLLLGAAKLGMDIRLGGPKAYWPDERSLDYVRTLALETGARITVTEDLESAVKGCDFIHTDVWLSMGEDTSQWGERIQQLLPYQVNSHAMALTGNPDAKFMHCLPAIANKETVLGQKLYKEYGLDGAEVVDEVFESKASIVFDQAENRLHTTKAVLVATLSKCL